MAQFNLGNLCGTNANFNKLEIQFEDLKSKLLNDIEAEASALVSNMTGGLVQLDLDLRSLLSEKPTLPNVSLQSEIKDLVGLAVGSNQYNSKLATLITQFGNALKGDNKDLAKLVAAAAVLIAGGEDICDLIPNMTIPAGGGVVKTLAKNVSQADKNSIVEVQSTIKTPVAASDLANSDMVKRLQKSAELFEKEIAKINASAGTTGTVTAETRMKFMEADAKIRNDMSKQGYELAVDSKLTDISLMEENLIGGEGTSLPWLNPDADSTAVKEQSYEEAVTAAIAPLKSAISKFAGTLSKSTASYPNNIAGDGTTVLFNDGSGEFQEFVEKSNKARQYQSKIVTAIMSNQKTTEFDTNSTIFKSFEKDAKTLATSLETSLASLETNFTRTITSNDKLIEEDVTISPISLPDVTVV